MSNTNKFVSEIKMFEFYAKNIWPIHRLFAKKHLSQRCKNCLISEKHSTLNENGICQDCQDYIPSKKEKNILLEKELNELLLKAKGRKDYDVMVLFSGGKDSTLLINKLKEEYQNLRILALSVDNTYMSPVALENISSTIKKLDVPHIIYRVPAKIYDKMFSYAITHLNKKGCSGTVDQFDGDFFHDIARNVAYQLEIPYILSGVSFTQVENILNLKSYKFPTEFEEKKREEVAGIKLKDIHNEDEMKYWWDGSNKDKNDIPRVIFPYYVWDYDEDYIKKKVIQLGLLSGKTNSPLLTNNLLIPLMGLVDIANLGYSSFEPEFCRMIREGKTKKEMWQNVFEMLEYSAKTRHFISKSIDEILERLNLTKEELKI